MRSKLNHNEKHSMIEYDDDDDDDDDDGDGDGDDDDDRYPTPLASDISQYNILAFFVMWEEHNKKRGHFVGLSQSF